MKPYYIVRLNWLCEREQFAAIMRREFMYSYDEEQRSSDGLSNHTAVFGTDTEQQANDLLQWLTNRYPENSYMICKSVKAGFREPGPLKFGEFTEQGFMPV